MKLVIDIPEEAYELLQNKGVDWLGAEHILNAVANGTPLSDNATNGDVIKALFPDIESKIDEKTGVMLVKWADGTAKCFKADWWDAPYKKEGDRE